MFYKTYLTLFILAVNITLFSQDNGKKAIIIGADSKIIQEIAKFLSKNQFTLGLTSNRTSNLESFFRELPDTTYTKYIDPRKRDAQEKISELIDEMEIVNVVVIDIGKLTTILPENQNVEKVDELNIGLIGLIKIIFEFLETQNSGNFIAISSTPNPDKTIYNYIEEMHNRMVHNNSKVHVTNIITGYLPIKNELLESEDITLFYKIIAEQTGKIILANTHTKNQIVSTPQKYSILEVLSKLIPGCIYQQKFT